MTFNFIKNKIFGREKIFLKSELRNSYSGSSRNFKNLTNNYFHIHERESVESKYRRIKLICKLNCYRCVNLGNTTRAG